MKLDLMVMKLVELLFLLVLADKRTKALEKLKIKKGQEIHESTKESEGNEIRIKTLEANAEFEVRNCIRIN